MVATDEEILEWARLQPLVGEQGIPWLPASWREALWQRSLESVLAEPMSTLPGVDTFRARLLRQDVLDAFGVGPLHGFLTAIIWGCGTGARNRARMLRVFSENDDVERRIADAVEVFAHAGPAEAWDAIRVENRLKYLGVAFGTKVAHFARMAQPPKAEPPIPLIADVNVELALGSPVTSDRDAYIDYCERAASLCGLLEGSRRRPDQIEYALFCVGKSR